MENSEYIDRRTMLMPSGHNLQEEVPDLVFNELQTFLRS